MKVMDYIFARYWTRYEFCVNLGVSEIDYEILKLNKQLPLVNIDGFECIDLNELDLTVLKICEVRL